MQTSMIKTLLKITLLSASLFLAMPSSAMAAPGIEVVENQFSQITITVNESVLRVTGAAGQQLYIYNITGVRVLSIKVDGSDKSYNLNLPKGCYIVKVGNVVRKISIR